MSNPIIIGTALAALAALVFGITTPVIQRLGIGIGPFTTAALLYLGATMGAVRRPGRKNVGQEATVRACHFPRLLVTAFFGAALGSTLFAWGLQRVPATYASLLLNVEAIFTVCLAAVIHREHIGRRVALAAIFMTAGGVVTVTGAWRAETVGLVGAMAIVAAVFCWALDSVLTRPLAELNPSAVVLVKSICGTTLTGMLALLLRESWPSPVQVVGLLICGTIGYGAGLRLYLLAQRRIGAGRTGSVFALAPFVGALMALALGDRPAGITTVTAGTFFIIGVALHLTEKHSHEHTHHVLCHDHAHTHDDEHHLHRHNPPVEGTHAHLHQHEPQVHNHAHGPDAHHVHEH